MKTKKISVTYLVIFREDVWYNGNAFVAGVEYTFKTLSESNHPADMFDDAYTAVHEMFGCLDDNEGRSMNTILPMGDPIIKSWEEVDK